jgi:formylglycine-generating enzyme required for sulfatase activity
VPSAAGDTLAVNSFPGNASPFGALDMAGNVLEWVADVYDSDFYSESPEENPQGPASGSERVMRGGSFGNADAAVYTTTRRYHKPANSAEEDVGFRCALPAP